MHRTTRSSIALMGIWLGVVSAPPAFGQFQKRGGDAQNTGNAGAVAALTPDNVHDLELVEIYPVGTGNATPVASGDLVVFGTADMHAYVIDLDRKKVLVALNTKLDTTKASMGFGISATPTIGTVTVPDGQGGTREEQRVYIATEVAQDGRGFWCLNLDRIRADRDLLNNDPGTSYICDGAA
jgi:hypothetical protein